MKAFLEIRDQSPQGFRLLIRREVTSGQTLDLEAEFSESFLRKVNLPVFKGIFVAAAHQERELISISFEQMAEVEPIALRFVVGHKTCSCCGVERAIVTLQGAKELADLGIRHLIAFGPHHPHHHLEQSEGAAQTLARAVREATQNWRGVPGMGVPVHEEPAIEDENAAYVRPAYEFTPLSALKPASQMLQDDKRGKVESDQRCRPDR